MMFQTGNMDKKPLSSSTFFKSLKTHSILGSLAGYMGQSFD